MRPLHAVVMGAIGTVFVAAGCSGAIPSSNGGPMTLKLLSAKGGGFLVDGRNHTLYLFEKDERGESYCNGACAAVWPPLETSAKPRAAPGVDAAALGTIKRADGDVQVTYHGHPLYYYAADASTPGKTKGQELEQFGSGWYLVAASGKPVESGGGGPSKSTPGSGSGSGGSGSGSSGSGSYGGGG